MPARQVNPRVNLSRYLFWLWVGSNLPDFVSCRRGKLNRRVNLGRHLRGSSAMLVKH